MNWAFFSQFSSLEWNVGSQAVTLCHFALATQPCVASSLPKRDGTKKAIYPSLPSAPRPGADGSLNRIGKQVGNSLARKGTVYRLKGMTFISESPLPPPPSQQVFYTFGASKGSSCQARKKFPACLKLGTKPGTAHAPRERGREGER